MRGFFVALHESAFGTKQTDVRFRGDSVAKLSLRLSLARDSVV